MVIRVIEHDFANALENAQKTDGMYEMNFPYSCVLNLRHTKNTPDRLKIKVNLPDGESFLYGIPNIKVQEYTRDEIFQKRLLFFLSFYIMRYEKKSDEISKDPEKLSALLSEYEQIRLQLREALPYAEQTHLYTRLAELIKDISDYMLPDESNMKKRMGEIMGGKVLELETDRILERGMRQGMEQGIKQGVEIANKSSVLCMLQDNLPINKIMLYSGCPLEEIMQIKEKAQKDTSPAPEELLPMKKQKKSK